MKAELALSRAQYRLLVKRMNKIDRDQHIPAWDKLHNKEMEAMGQFGVQEGSIKIDDLYSHRFTIHRAARMGSASCTVGISKKA
jgi:hypothetical protein